MTTLLTAVYGMLQDVRWEPALDVNRIILGGQVAFIVGLLSSNTLIALAGTFGFVSATKSWPLYVAISVVTAAGSFFVGTIFLLGQDGILPAFFGG